MTATQTPEIITRTIDLISTITDEKIEQGAAPDEALAFATAYVLTKMRNDRQQLFALLGEELARANMRAA